MFLNESSRFAKNKIHRIDLWHLTNRNSFERRGIKKSAKARLTDILAFKNILSMIQYCDIFS